MPQSDETFQGKVPVILREYDHPNGNYVLWGWAWQMTGMWAWQAERRLAGAVT